MRLIRLEHMDLFVNDIEKSVEFYRKLGFCPDGTNDGATPFTCPPTAAGLR